MALDVASKGYNVTIHVCGDRGVRVALNTAEAVRKAGYNKTLFSTTHTELVSIAGRKRFKERDVTVQTTGNWAIPQKDYFANLGEERASTLDIPFHTHMKNGVNLALGSDWPATTGGFEYGVNPFVNMYAAMHRRAPKELQNTLSSYDATLKPVDEVLTIEEAITAYTLGGAKILGIADQVGTIEVGKKADIILLDQNLFEINPEKIYKTKVLATMFDGKIVHDVTLGVGDNKVVDKEHSGEGAIGPYLRDKD